jgi:hypothetical protein
VALSPEENDYYNKMLGMNEDPRQSTILFENDDPSQNFEILRLTQRPTRYRDFEGGVKYVVSTRLENSEMRAASTAYVDTIVPNTPYYYMFRSYDAHGHTSYPSDIYEIILNDNEGAVFPQIRTVPLLGNEENTQKTKMVKRFLQIKPQISQTTIDWTNSMAGDWDNSAAPVSRDLPMGVTDVSIWDKRFKIRLTSKKTGKKIDLNVKFTKEYDDRRIGVVTGD